MKKIILSLIAIVLISFSTSASNINKKFCAKVDISTIENFENQEMNSTVSVGFNSIQSLNEFNYNQLSLGAAGSEPARCSVTVTVSVGVVSVSVSAECDCSDVGATIKRLIKQARQALLQ